MATILQWIHDNAGMIVTASMGVGLVGAGVVKILSVLSAVIKLLNDIYVALNDKKLTSEELDNIIADAKGIPIAIKNAFKKE